MRSMYAVCIGGPIAILFWDNLIANSVICILILLVAVPSVILLKENRQINDREEARKYAHACFLLMLSLIIVICFILFRVIQIPDNEGMLKLYPVTLIISAAFFCFSIAYGTKKNWASVILNNVLKFFACITSSVLSLLLIVGILLGSITISTELVSQLTASRSYPIEALLEIGQSLNTSASISSIINEASKLYIPAFLYFSFGCVLLLPAYSVLTPNCQLCDMKNSFAFLSIISVIIVCLAPILSDALYTGAHVRIGHALALTDPSAELNSYSPQFIEIKANLAPEAIDRFFSSLTSGYLMMAAIGSFIIGIRESYLNNEYEEVPFDYQKAIRQKQQGRVKRILKQKYQKKRY